MSLNKIQTDGVQATEKELPGYEDLNTAFETALQKPEQKPMGFRERLIHATKHFYDRFTDRLWGIDTPDEYNTGKVFIPTRTGTKYQFEHIKKGVKESQTSVLIQNRRKDDKILENEIQTTIYLDDNQPQKQVSQSRHDVVTQDGIRTQILTEGVTLPGGESLSKTQNFETGETTFRRNKGGLFQEWTFDRARKLISRYEGRFGEVNKPDLTSQFDYIYAPGGGLLSALETRTIITPDGETVKRIHHSMSDKIGKKALEEKYSR